MSSKQTILIETANLLRMTSVSLRPWPAGREPVKTVPGGYEMAQAIWADEFARSVPDIEEDQDEDLWHVRMSPDDVKVLSLTRLDDLFRLSLVDAETEVWQPGMKSWVPLGVVAGIEDEEPATTVPRPPRPPSPPRPVVQPLDPFGMVSAPKPLPVIPKPLAPVAITYPTPESVRPITISEIYTVERGGGFGRFLIGLALIAGLAVTLYRNDVVRNVAKSAQLEGVYAKVEKALGGPSFGTPQSLDKLAAALGVSETPSMEPLAAAPLAAAIELPKAAPVTPAATPKTTQASSDSAPAV
ncbi:MAG TPA: hypothetical protein VM686_02145, partial [Polyangiaceae bacterium]|nr:hypothetical protein [Polyangiaceae bacterium]